ncbi:MAG TPA: hypothetical protein VER96_17370, partial [Polyangiaceae bacterium]|nr:hypothetical protein [Polyangiaceae bacterium]
MILHKDACRGFWPEGAGGRGDARRDSTGGVGMRVGRGSRGTLVVRGLFRRTTAGALARRGPARVGCGATPPVKSECVFVTV